jgi:hypothetical protein
MVMPVLPITGLGATGLIKDVPETGVQLGGLTRAENIRFKGTSITRAGAWNNAPVDCGHNDGIFGQKLLRHMIPGGSEELYVITNTRQIFITDGATKSEVSVVGHSPISGEAAVTSTSLALLPYFSAENYPLVGKEWGPAEVFQPAMAGSPHEDSTWRVVRAHKDRLFVFNETTTGNEHRQRAQWSGPVGDRQLATDWETGSLSSTAGWVDLVGFRGEILDAYPLGEFMYVYGAYGISRMWESGDEFIFGNAPVFSEDGLLATHCIVPVSEYGHFVVGRNRIYIFDGQQAHPIAVNRVEDEFRRTLDTNKQHLMFVYPDYQNSEVWVCYPSNDTAESYFKPGTTSHCNRALVWNYRHNAWSFRDIPNLVDMMSYAMPMGILTWDDTTEQWTTFGGTWASTGGLTVTLPTALTKKFTAPGGVCETSVLRFDPKAYPTTKWNDPFSVIERRGIIGRELGFKAHTTKMLHRITLDISADVADGANLGLGAFSRLHNQGAETFSGNVPYDPTAQSWVNFRLSGQQLGYKVFAGYEASMDLSQVDLEIEQIAER